MWNIDEEFWANLPGTNAGTYFSTQKKPLFKENVV